MLFPEREQASHEVGRVAALAEALRALEQASYPSRVSCWT
jgi:hypothetical protein